MGDAVSALTLVRHFLVSGRSDEFNATVRKHRSMVGGRDGFVSLRQLRASSGASDEERVLLLEFQNETQLMSWRTSEEHKQIAAEYRRLWAREPEVQIFISEEC
jgi:heme-degrading monooxygenase HmoA